MKYLFTFIIYLILLSAYPGFAEDANNSTSKVRIAGSSTVGPILQHAAKSFYTKYGISLDLKMGGSNLGYQQLLADKIDIANMSRHLTHEEKFMAENLAIHLLGYDGLTIVLHRDIDIKNITHQQLQDLYLGKIKNWRELGGPSVKVNLITKGSQHGSQPLFLKFVGLECQKKSEQYAVHRLLGEKTFSNVEARIIRSNHQALALTSWTPGAISYVSVGDALEYAHKYKDKIKLPSLDGIPVSMDNIRNGSFPIIRPLHMVTREKPKESTKKFIDYMLSPEGQQFVLENKFVPIHAHQMD